MTRGPKNLQSTDAWRAIEEEFLAGGDASRAQKAFTLAIDEVVVKAYRTAIAPVFPESLAMLAGGAYGLGQTFPYSDLDIVLLLDSGKQADALKELLPEMVRLLWNAGLRVNSPVLTVAECLEAVERASVPGFSLLDRRLLAGDRAVYEKLEVRLPSALALHCQKMSQRLCELARGRHGRYQNTPLHAEPDVKAGPGGLQDVRLMDWLAMLKGERRRTRRRAEPGGRVRFVRALLPALSCRMRPEHSGFRNSGEPGTTGIRARPEASDWMREYFECARDDLQRGAPGDGQG